MKRGFQNPENSDKPTTKSREFVKWPLQRYFNQCPCRQASTKPINSRNRYSQNPCLKLTNWRTISSAATYPGWQWGSSQTKSVWELATSTPISLELDFRGLILMVSFQLTYSYLLFVKKMSTAKSYISISETHSHLALARCHSSLNLPRGRS